MNQISIILALLSLLIAGLKTLEKCTVYPPVEPTVVRGPHGLEIFSQVMGGSHTDTAVSAGSRWIMMGTGPLSFPRLWIYL